MRVVFLMAMIVPLVLFGQVQNPGAGRGPMRQRVTEPPTEQTCFAQMMLVQYLDLHHIQREYFQRVRQISEQTRLQSQYLRQQLARYERRFFELASEGELMPQVQAELFNVLEEMHRINRQMFALQKQAMKQIEDLNAQREKKLIGAMENWLKRARKNPNELMNFVKFVEKARTKVPSMPPSETE